MNLNQITYQSFNENAEINLYSIVSPIVKFSMYILIAVILYLVGKQVYNILKLKKTKKRIKYIKNNVLTWDFIVKRIAFLIITVLVMYSVAYIHRTLYLVMYLLFLFVAYTIKKQSSLNITENAKK